MPARTTHNRRSLRLRSYDYAQAGAYFVTIVAKDRVCLFGHIADGHMHLSEAGAIVAGTWDRLPSHYPYSETDAFVVMPNHVHGVLILRADGRHQAVGRHQANVRAGFKPAPTGEISLVARHPATEIVRAFKTFSARRVNVLHDSPGSSLWQRNYYAHVVRGEAELDHIRRYIAENPLRWARDSENPAGH